MLHVLDFLAIGSSSAQIVCENFSIISIANSHTHTWSVRVYVSHEIVTGYSFCADSQENKEKLKQMHFRSGFPF